MPDGWNDFSFMTMFDLWFRPEYGSPHELGTVKLARFDQEPGPSPLEGGLETSAFPRGEWFSLGQDDLYYDRIRMLGDTFRMELLEGLSDIAYDLDLFDLVRDRPVTRTSLLRSVEEGTVRSQFHRIARGGARLTEFRFRYHFPLFTEAPQSNWPARPTQTPSIEATPPRDPLDFVVTPESTPSSNVHVLIGRNGVGKTRLMGHLAGLVVAHHEARPTMGQIEYLPTPTAPAGEPFVNVVTVSFSAFDAFASGFGWHVEPAAKYTHVGLVAHSRDSQPKSRAQLAGEFLNSLNEIAAAGRYARWTECVGMLHQGEHIPLFLTEELIDSDPTAPAAIGAEKVGRVREAFASLSSGHAIVMLTIARLVELVAEQSLVLIDEPEAHLHPPLLSAFVRVLATLLTERNGVAIVATHSPVVLQEVPRDCVYKLIRTGDRRRARRPRLETYGENVGVLTHEVFGLEVMESGFYAEIEKAVAELETYEAVMDRFGGRLGGEARGLIRVLLAEKEAENGNV
ncbi:AAA family ATPase [Streptomyces chartreusis]|uniref:AAA family ATPase n=1 Tax=Streptomyces chartreusis TaxID=1969 RepID=UPI0037F2FB10